MQLRDRKILVTGPAGQIAFPLAARLAQHNEVWGIARFSDAEARERCDKAGIRTVRDEAVTFALENGASKPGQTNAVLKALTEGGYYLTK